MCQIYYRTELRLSVMVSVAARNSPRFGVLNRSIQYVSIITDFIFEIFEFTQILLLLIDTNKFHGWKKRGYP